MRFYVLALPFSLSPPPLLLLGSNKWKEEEILSFFLFISFIFIALYYWCTVVFVFLLDMIEIDMFNNIMRGHIGGKATMTFKVYVLRVKCRVLFV